MKAAALAALLAAHGHDLRTGGWNARIHAAHELGNLGPAAVPLLSEAAEDADWQVRMTAVHQLGRLGKPALPALEASLREEPCRTVRLTALHWMGAMGPDASDAVARALEDESGMVRLMGKYWLKKDGVGNGGEQHEAENAAREELKACVASPAPGKAPWAGKKKPADAAPAAEVEQSTEVVVTRDPILPKKAPETLPPAGPGIERPEPEKGIAAYSATDRQRLKELDDILAPNEAKPESMPAAPAGISRSAPETAGADYAKDDGKGKKAPPDTVPALLALLKDPDPAKRARAADELGKRGAKEAEPALAAALADRVPRVRASAALALGNLGAAADPAVPALVKALKRGPEEVAWSAAIALGRVGTPRARKAFARQSRETAGELVRPAAKKP